MKTPEEIAAEEEAARVKAQEEAEAAAKKAAEEEAERKKFRGKRNKIATMAEFKEAQKEEDLKIGVHYLYTRGMDEVVSIPTDVLASEGIERSLLFAGVGGGRR